MAVDAIDWIEARKWLVALTDDLRASPTTSSDALLAARKDIAIALMDGQINRPDTFEHRFIYNAQSVSLTPSRWVPYEAAKPTGTPTVGQQVVRRTPGLPSKAVNLDNWPESKMFGGKASVTHGPFLDSLNRPVYIDVFKPSRVQEYAFPADASPAYLYVAAPVTPSGRFEAILGAGTVWIKADLFTRSNPPETRAPGDTYFGLAIESGAMTMPPVSTASRTLTLRLAGGATSSAIYSITPVANVAFSFTFANSVVSATITSISPGNFTVLGSAFNVQQPSSNVMYDYSMGRINFAMTADNSSFKPVSQTTKLIEVTGASEVRGVAWSILTKDADKKLFYHVPSPGAFGLFLAEGSIIGLRGDNLPVSLGACTLIAESGSITITGSKGNMSLRSRTVAMGKVAVGSARRKSSVTFRAKKHTKFYYMATAAGDESWTVLADMTMALDQPRTVNNESVSIECRNGGDFPWSTLTWFHEAGSSDVALNIQASNTRWPMDTNAFALKNLLIKADMPGTIDMTGRYEAGALVSGAVTMVGFLRYTLPFLPDPYATNFELELDPSVEKIGLGYLTISQVWKEETMNELDISLITQLAIPARTMERNKDSKRDDPILDQIKSGDAKYWGDGSFILQELASGVIPDLGVGQLVHIPNGILAAQLSHPPTLLDISSNSSQFGVVFGTGLESPQRDDILPGSFAIVEDFGISGCMLESSSSNVRVMALPAIQWEPVLEDKLPHETYVFPYSGPSTQIATQEGTGTAPSVKLVPVAPREAIDGLVGSFNSTTKISVAVRSSLPFGMVALAKMDNERVSLRPSAQLQKIDFMLGGEEDPKTKLKNTEFQPAHQLWFIPPGRLWRRPDSGIPTSPPPRQPLKLVGSSDVSFTGITTILAMGVGPLKDPPSTGRGELIDPNTGIFNDDMKAKVPLHRFDLSGYGSTVFSDWKRVLGPPPDPQTAITNVLMNVLTGRTSREVVEVQSVMGPFAVTVVKVIEMRRLNSGTVLRHESEWQPTSVGRYFYQNPDIITHPGIIRGVTDVRNIKAVSGTTTVSDVPLELRKVRFDCNVEIDDGGVVRSIPGVNLDGCIFLKDLSQPSGPTWYNNVLQQLDLGGHIDAIVQIGTSGQQKRLTSITVKPSLDPTSNKQVAVVAALGTPIFPGGGQWSFARTQNSDGYKQPQPVDLAKGVPLVKSGRHDSPSLGSLVTPYLFRDPQDLLSDLPNTAYNIIHGAASHRVLFTSPEIPFHFPPEVQKGFQAARVWVADSLALGKSASIFPSLPDCLPVLPGLPDGEKQVLEILQRSGGYKFEPTRMLDGVEIPYLELPDIERIVKNDASVQAVVQAIKDETTLSVALNTAENLSKMDVTNIHMVTKTVTGTVQDASRVIGRLSSDIQKVGGLLGADPDLHLPDLPGLPKAVDEVKHVFGPALEQVQKTVSFLENLKFLPHFKVSMTNEWAMVMATSMNRDDLLDKIQPPTREAVRKIIETFDFLISAAISLSAFLLKMHIGTTIKIPTGVGPIVALGNAAFDVALGTSGVEVNLDLGFGIGVDFSVGPFSASASYTQSQSILFREGVFGLGITACMRAHVDLVIASADLYLEAKLLVVGGECHPPVKHAEHGGTTIWGYASVKIAFHVSIFLVCNIGVEEDAHWDSNLNGGGCELDDMTDLVPV
ncbi:hypothetical protein FBEOM_11016 [Fusarium beomiforme]|uniref:Uncharacterized protein n=1 Tax=Fusarium beomiforme TaxID=44412 RepID=A0A9P5ABD4_9HYPO|nr:hypothetical protein FBEOM_11016 [Fusarium beomiforme]